MPDAEQPDEIARETARGRSARTPGLALGGVTLVIGALVAVVLVIVVLVYLLA